MNEHQFIEQYNIEEPMFKAWGDYVTDLIISELGKTENVNYFLKIKPTPRVKDVNSLVTKAFYRGKNYEHPYNDITDKVGTRFVVLLKEDIDKICRIIEECNIWTNSKDRDFDEERERNPTTFEYQSVHFIVRNKEELQVGNVFIKKGTPCEIQIRTLLQHAYSELTHDTIYKPKTSSRPHVHRLVARSMALIETTDEIFTEVNSLFSNNDYDILGILKDAYEKVAAPDYEENLNTFILDAYKELLSEDLVKDLNQYIVEKNETIKEVIETKYDQFLIYRQPVVIFLFFLVEKHKYKAKKYWPLTQDKLKPIYSALGIAFPDY
ncbi:hypothetical protein J27TS8_05120 [Robertmurraya siralis]|uniref:RelA/SpoT domain-containing protein n=1 Tax=Robertmurraya siralis TaxID=77777 RepID=A0A919WEV7_9BACI|nr:RelA/SpoT domain-containing protein [Robertmurraya siralis]PAE21975.1 hypothetical protein CHH80_03515 [Bacillus sp. 7504-2]GIN60519.1 hypothetical protein J27TS8_05120 [Robertmurraya siralis]